MEQGKIKYILTITWKVAVLGAFLALFAWILYTIWTIGGISPKSSVDVETVSIHMVVAPLVTLIGAAISGVIGALVALVISISKLRS